MLHADCAHSLSLFGSFKDVNIITDNVEDCDFKSDFKLEITKPGTVHGFLGWFDTFFTKDGRAVTQEKDLSVTSAAREVYFSTGPQAKPTHWKQTFFLLAEPLHNLKPGDILSGTFSCHKDLEYARGLEVEIIFNRGGTTQSKAQVWLIS